MTSSEAQACLANYAVADSSENALFWLFFVTLAQYSICPTIFLGFGVIALMVWLCLESNGWGRCAVCAQDFHGTGRVELRWQP